jgi:hydroxyacylglutathione hydrolase
MTEDMMRAGRRVGSLRSSTCWERIVIIVEIIETPSLGDRSYVVHDGTDAFVVDPQRDIDRVLATLEQAGVRLVQIFETHIHNDYVSGGLALARRTAAEYAVPAGDQVVFDHRSLADGEEIRVGSMLVRAVHTPGHTHSHLSYVVIEDGGGPTAVFTGGSLLYGTVGRTDLIDESETEGLTRAQHRSVRGLVNDLPDHVAVYPTHGFGSFCASSGGGDRSSGTIAEERAENLALTIDDQDRFVERLMDGLSEHPAYYAHMSLLNRSGPFEADLSLPSRVETEELRRRLMAGEWVVDLRCRRAFAADHFAGAIGVELDDPYSTYIGWLIPWGSRLTLIAERPEQVAEAQRQLIRIGVDQLGGAATGALEQIGPTLVRSSFPVSEFVGLAARVGADADVGAKTDADDASTSLGLRAVVVDVRRRDEWCVGHVKGSVSLPLHQLLEHRHRLPEGELWVHCTSGYRAAIASSLLARAGYPVVLIDDAFANAADAGLEVVSG